MSHTIAAVILLVLAHAATAQAELRFVMRSEARTAATTDATASNSLMAMGADMFVKMIFPDGPAVSSYIVGPRGTRVELSQASAGMPAGTVMLSLPDGTSAVLNPSEQTYWTMAGTPQLMQGMFAKLKPDVSVTPSGVFDMISGVRAERIAMTVSMTLPIPPGTQLPPGLEPTLKLTTDLWLTDKYREYEAPNGQMIVPGLPSLGELMPKGFIMKSVLRGSILGAYEIESLVTEIREEAVPAELFEIPKDFKEVESPIRGIKPHVAP